jgi:3-deoxy-D-manno-octulosonate 8-phosphate phosphatase (KDO 8-P phosphatase)
MLSKIKTNFFIIDVDGTMTDGGIYYSSNGDEQKKFNTKDAAAFKFLLFAGIQVFIITGRKSSIVEKRMKELGLSNIYQGVHDKLEFLLELASLNKITLSETSFIGDDLNDLSAMKIVKYVFCPFNSSRDVKNIADYVSKFNGGDGAIRDIIEKIFRNTALWKNFVNNYK